MPTKKIVKHFISFSDLYDKKRIINPANIIEIEDLSESREIYYIRLVNSNFIVISVEVFNNIFKPLIE